MVQMNKNYFGQVAKLNVNSKLTVGALKKQEGPQQVKCNMTFEKDEIKERYQDIKPGDEIKGLGRVKSIVTMADSVVIFLDDGTDFDVKLS